MAEKRRGLGRGLGALIPSAPPEEQEVSEGSSQKQPGRPADLFFTSGEGTDGTPGAKRAARSSGINKDALMAPSRRSPAKANGKPATPPAIDLPEHTKPASEAAPRTKAPSRVSRETPAVGSPQGAPAEVSDEGAQEAQDDAAKAGSSERGIPPETGEMESAGGPTGVPLEAARGRTAGPGPSVEAGEASGPAATPTGAAQEAAGGSDGASGKPVDPSAAPTLPAGEGASNEGLLTVPGARFAELPIDAIHPNRKQPRTVFDADDMAELVHSIREIGVLQPIVVRPSPEEGDAPFELVMGERRWRATREAGLETVPAIIRSTADDDLLRDALLENLHRSSLNPLEEAAAYQQLLDDFGCSHDELAERIGRSRPQISNTLRLMKLPPLVQRRVAAGVLSAGHARALLALADPAEMEKLAQRIVAEGLSVRSTEEIVAMSDGLRRPAKPSNPRSGARHERLDYLATSLSDRLDTSVKITLGARKGKVSIEFASVDDLNRIMTVLAPPTS